MLQVVSINLLFNNSDTITINRKDIRGLRFYGLFQNMDLLSDYSLDAYTACQSFELKLEKEAMTSIDQEMGVPAIDRIAQGDIVAIEIVPSVGMKCPISVPYDEHGKLQCVTDKENVITVFSSFPEQ